MSKVKLYLPDLVSRRFILCVPTNLFRRHRRDFGQTTHSDESTLVILVL